MKKEIAFKAIDFYIEHSHEAEFRFLSFYGGEPLIKFDLLKDCVEYIERKSKNIKFCITTNATLINADIADFLFKHKFKILVSIDGPQEIHDQNRKYINGKGSYKSTLIGIHNLKKKYKNSFKDLVGFSMVYSPPYSEEKKSRIKELWDEVKWLPKECNIFITYENPNTLYSRFTKEKLFENRDLLQWSFENYFERGVNEFEKSNFDLIVKTPLAKIMQRVVLEKSSEAIPYLNGCCIPGVIRLHVTVKGEFKVCERVSSFAPNIGNIHKGIDRKVVNEVYINEYIKNCFCEKCWAARLCGLCYSHAFNNQGELSSEEKEKHCEYERWFQERLLTYYCYLAEKYPEELAKLGKYKLK